MLLGLMIIAVAVAVSILRYRLYDIDLVISKTLLVAGLAGFITATYVAIVVGVGTLVGRGDEPNLVLSVAATALGGGGVPAGAAQVAAGGEPAGVRPAGDAVRRVERLRDQGGCG